MNAVKSLFDSDDTSKLRTRLQSRLAELKAEYGSGQEVLHDLESQVTSLRATLLRISGAIQVLDELLAEDKPPPICAVAAT